MLKKGGCGRLFYVGNNVARVLDIIQYVNISENRQM